MSAIIYRRTAVWVGGATSGTMVWSSVAMVWSSVVLSVGICGTMRVSLTWSSVIMTSGAVSMRSIGIMSGGVFKGGSLVSGALCMEVVGAMNGGFVRRFLDLKEDGRLSTVKFFQSLFLLLVDCKDDVSLSCL